MKNGAVNVACIFGSSIIAGLILGVLCAPQSGAETRETLGRKAAELKEEARDMGRTMKREYREHGGPIEETTEGV